MIEQELRSVCLLLTEQELVDCEVAPTEVRQRSAVQCDSCGCWSVDGEEKDKHEIVTVADTPLITGLRWCIDCCQNLCSNCVLVHGSLAGTRSHCVIPLPLRDHEFQGSPCPTHVDRTSDLFCWHCRQLVCAACTTSPEHRDHSCDDVTSSAARLRTLLLNDFTSVDKRRRRCDQLEADVAADKHTWLSSVQAADNEIKVAADKFRALVDRHCALLSDELFSIKQLRLKELQSRLEDVAQERGRLNSLWKNIHAMVDTAGDVELLLHAGNLHESVERCLTDSTADTSHVYFSSRQTVMFIPSVSQRQNAGDGDSLLGHVQVVDGDVNRGLDTGQTAGARVKRSSEGTRRARQHQTQPVATLYYRQLLATLNDSHLPVCGLAVVADRLYVCRSESADVDIYDASRTTYRRQQRSIRVPGLTGPSDMAGTCGSCEEVATLFISSESDGDVFRVTLMTTRAGDEHTRWTTDDRPYGVSMMESKHLLVLSRQSASVSLLDDDGRPLRRLRLPASVASPWSAVYIPNSAEDAAGDLVVCHGNLTRDVDGRRVHGVSRLDWSTGAVTRRCQWVQQPASENRGCASVLHVVRESEGGEGGGFLLADQCCDRVQRVDSSLTSHQSLMQTSAGGDHDSAVEQPRRLCVDSARQRLVVGLHDGRVRVFANGCVVM